MSIARSSTLAVMPPPEAVAAPCLLHGRWTDVRVTQDAVQVGDGGPRLGVHEHGRALVLAAPAPAGDPDTALAALQAVFTAHPGRDTLLLDASLGASIIEALRASGALDAAAENGRWRARREAIWQHPAAWLPAARAPYAQGYAVSEGRRHPRRPAKPQGTVYRRHIPWLDRSLSLRVLDPERDLPHFHRWMNDPVVDAFWEEAGELERHRAYVERIAGDPHALGLIGCFDDQPFGYFETYWAKEDRIAPYYDAADYDRGWHVLIGEADRRGKPWLTAWMPAISHYLFLDDCRTQRLVIEPRWDNRKMMKSLARCGYALLKHFDFPHKRAMLGILTRERYFGEALWIPHADTAAPGAVSPQQEPV